MMTPTDREAELNKNEEKKWNPFEKLCGLRRETPEFRRCCFCVPLRRGLVGWGYLKVALNMWAVGWLAYFTVYYLEVEAVEMTLIVLLLVDATFHVLFIVGGHQENGPYSKSHCVALMECKELQKKMKFLKISYIYSFVWLSLVMLGLSWLVSRDMRLVVRYIREHEHYSYIGAIVLPDFCLMFSIFIVQIYWILLIRSLLAKLQDHTLELQFNNQAAADAECTLHIHNSSGTDISDTDSPDEKPAASVESMSSKYVKL